ncbi:MAG: CDP-glucose 4,6-dehydratase [Oscillospiraceae bacterium]|nr:CDP-glucose 4,6-dehydratase [Oscillospiraceae bacterium]
MNNFLDFYKGKRVFITGHTGFKGAWLCRILRCCGAEVTGYAKEPPTDPSLYDLINAGEGINSVTGDIRDYEKLLDTFREARPEIVIHMAAQPIVREGYRNPRETYEINVMGTVNILECVRVTGRVKSFLNVTTDKVYKNHERLWSYREYEELGGYDPYSNSKSCSELVTGCYSRSFLMGGEIPVSTARAGNVIGGGDFAADRIIPDCVRAAQRGEDIILRNPYSIRPYQHVLEPLMAYLLIAYEQYDDEFCGKSYNVGPDDSGCFSTGDIADMFVKKWGRGLCRKDVIEKNAPHEANFLKLDNSLIRSDLGWRPVWSMDKTMDKIIEWSRLYIDGASAEVLRDCIDRQIEEYKRDIFDCKGE